MVPALADGDEVDVEVFPRAPRVGEVVLLLDLSGATILHRVIQVSPLGVRTLGDALASADPLLPADRVLGIARVPSRPFLAYARRWALDFRAHLRRRLRASG